MLVNVLMPAASPSMEKGIVARWLKREGEPVAAGEILAEIETDKATVEVEATDTGMLVRIVIPEGTPDVPVSETIGVIATAGEDGSEFFDAPEKELVVETMEPRASAFENVAPPREAQSLESATRRTFSSPLARRLAKMQGIPFSELVGSGPKGRIIERDLLEAIRKREEADRGRPLPGPSADASRPAPIALDAQPLEGPVPVRHDAMRQAIARRLVESKTTIPHFYLSMECDLDALVALREQFNQTLIATSGAPIAKASINDFMIKALASALHQTPDANVTWSDTAILHHRHSDVGVAIAIPDGLIAPIIRCAENKNLLTISKEMKTLAERARARKLRPEEYQGGTSTISNLGMLGIRRFAAIINPPQTTIFAIGAAEKRVIVRGDAPGVATMMTVTLSVDHRAIDGAIAAKLLGAFKRSLENPLSLLV